MTNENTCDILLTVDADLAHLVERDLAKVEVAGSSPVIRSNKKAAPPLVGGAAFLLSRLAVASNRAELEEVRRRVKFAVCASNSRKSCPHSPLRLLL